MSMRRLAVTLLVLAILAYGEWRIGPSSVMRGPTVPHARRASAAAARNDATSPAYPVVRVVDGDTVVVDMDGQDRKVRLLGVNAPESVDPRRPVQCFGPEASAHLHAMLAGKRVRLTADPTQADVDAYGRLLRYLSLDDGSDIDLHLIMDGFAREYTFRAPYARRDAYAEAERAARAARRGLWAEDACGAPSTH